MGGRPKGKSLTTTLKAIIETPINIKNFVTGEKELLTLREHMAFRMAREAMNGNVSAFKEIVDRTDGKPIQTVQDTQSTLVVDMLSIMTDEQLAQLELKYAPEDDE